MKYDAFISYRHSPLDLMMAKKIHSGLETFRVPAAIQKKSGKKNIKRVFRDQEELPIGSDLDDNIAAALRESEYLIVICSPRTPESYWVCKEIENFIQMHDRHHVLAVLIEGEPEESFPPMLLSDENGNPVEPLAADIRGESDKERKKKLKTELVRLAAPLLGCSYDDLKQRHRERRIKRIATFSVVLASIVACLGVGFAIYNAKMAAEIEKNYEMAVTNYNLATENYKVAVENYDQAVENQSKNLADKVLELFETGDREDAVLIGLEALEDNRPYVPEVEYALSRALYTYENGESIGLDQLLKHELPVSFMVMEPNREYLLTKDQGDTVYVWRLEDNSLVSTIESQLSDSGYFIRPIEINLVNNEVVICREFSFEGYSLEGEALWQTPLESVNYCTIVPEESLAICVGVSNVQVVDLNKHSVIKKYDYEDEDYSFTGDAVYYKERNEVLVPCFTSSDLPGKVALLDLNDGSMKFMDILSNYVLEAMYDTEGNPVIASCPYGDLLGGDSWHYEIILADYNAQTGSVQWRYTTSADSFGGTNASAIMKKRQYSDLEGDHKEIIMTVDNTVITLDETSGNVLTQFSVSNAINALLLSASSNIGYIAESNGSIEIADMTNGKLYPNNTIDTQTYLSNVLAGKDGLLAVNSWQSPDVSLLRFHEGDGMEVLCEEESNVWDVRTSEDGQYLVVTTDGSIDSDFHFYKEGNKKTGVYDPAIEGYEGKTGFAFTPDNTFVILERNGRVQFVNPETLKAELLEVTVPEFGRSYYYYLSDDKTKALMYGSGSISMVDLMERKEVGYWDSMEDRIGDAVLSADAKTIYYMSRNGGLHSLDVATGDITDSSHEELMIYGQMAGDRILAVSPDGKYLAVCCGDGLRILNLVTDEIEAYVDFLARQRVFMRFDEKGEKLILQGDDYYIHIYDVVAKQMVYSSNEQFNTVSEAYLSEANSKMALVTNAEMLVLETEGYRPIAQIRKGKWYLSQSNSVLVVQGGVVYRFPFQTLDSIKANARRQFPDAQMTPEKRLKYHLGDPIENRAEEASM